MKWWDGIREWWTRDEHDVCLMRGTRDQQRETDALIAESFARKGKGAQGIQRAMAVRIANAIREGRSA